MSYYCTGIAATGTVVTGIVTSITVTGIAITSILSTGIVKTMKDRSSPGMSHGHDVDPSIQWRRSASCTYLYRAPYEYMLQILRIYCEYPYIQ